MTNIHRAIPISEIDGGQFKKTEDKLFYDNSYGAHSVFTGDDLL